MTLPDHDSSHPHHHTLLSLREKIAHMEERIEEIVREGVHGDHRRLAGFQRRLHLLQQHAQHLFHTRGER